MAGPGLVGRTTELERGTAALIDATRSQAGSLLYEGAPGIGKSTLLDALASEASDRGFRVLRASCDEPDEQRPFGVFIELLGLERAEIDPRCEQLGAAVLRADHLGMSEPRHTYDARVKVVDEIVAVLASMCLDAPVAVIVDDLQWSDPSSLGALRSLVGAMAGHRFALLGAHRSSTSTDLAQIEAQRVVVRGLSDDEVRLLVRESTRAEPDASLLELTARAGGNPLFVTELVGALLDEGAVEIAAGTATAISTELPESVQATVRRRMAGMPQETVSLLTVAAVLGEPFSLETLAVVDGTDGVDIYACLAPAIEADVLQAVGERFDFRHDVVREALYHHLPTPARRAFHLKVARALAGANAPVLRVAHHYALGAEPGDREAASWLRRAGEELTPYGPGTALALLEQAAGLVGRVSVERPAILGLLMQAALQAGRFDVCDRTARELLGSTPDAGLRRAAHMVRYGMALFEDRYIDALEETAAALRTVDLTDADRAFWRSLEATTLASVGRLPAALEAADEALRLGRATQTPYATGRALTIQAAGQRVVGNYAAALELAEQSLQEYVPAPALPIRNQSPSHDLFQAYVTNAPMLIEADEFDRAEDGLRAATIGFADDGQMPMLTMAHRALAVLLFHAGRWDEALAEVETARGISEGIGGGRAVIGDPVPELLARSGDLLAATEALEQAASTLDPGLPVPGNASLAAARAYLDEAAGELARGRGSLSALHDLGRAVGIVLDVRIVSVPLARLLVESGDAPAAEKLLTETEEAAARASDIPSVVAAAAHVRGLVTGDDGAFTTAIELFRSSPRRVSLAAALEDAGTHGAVDRAIRARRLGEALELFESFGAIRDGRRVVARLRSLGVRSGARGPRGRPVSGWDSLTPSEVRVIELVSEGLTNPQIGDRLFLSRKTVATHVSAALRKLGVSSRTEIAAMVARRGLT